MPKFKFTSHSIVEATDCEAAKMTFADNSLYFAANADCEELTTDKEEHISTEIESMADTYVLIRWPFSQEYMEEPWFDSEAVLADTESAGSAAYFIPIKYIV